MKKVEVVIEWCGGDTQTHTWFVHHSPLEAWSHGLDLVGTPSYNGPHCELKGTPWGRKGGIHEITSMTIRKIIAVVSCTVNIITTAD